MVCQRMKQSVSYVRDRLLTLRLPGSDHGAAYGPDVGVSSGSGVHTGIVRDGKGLNSSVTGTSVAVGVSVSVGVPVGVLDEKHIHSGFGPVREVYW